MITGIQLLFYFSLAIAIPVSLTVGLLALLKLLIPNQSNNTPAI